MDSFTGRKGFANQLVAGIGDEGRAGVADEGNFRALFVSMERDQIRRGVLKPGAA